MIMINCRVQMVNGLDMFNEMMKSTGVVRLLRKVLKIVIYRCVGFGRADNFTHFLQLFSQK